MQFSRNFYGKAMKRCPTQSSPASVTSPVKRLVERSRYAEAASIADARASAITQLFQNGGYNEHQYPNGSKIQQILPSDVRLGFCKGNLM